MTLNRRFRLFGILWPIAAFILLLAACGDLAPTKSDGDLPPFERSYFEVRAGHEVAHDVEVESGHTLEYRVEASRDVNIWLFDPRGLELGRWERADHIALDSLEAELSGEYTFEFDNSYSRVTRKSVTLLYRVLPPAQASSGE